MPMYDYECSKCKTTESEFVHSWEEEVLCETCNSPKERLFPDRLGPINFGFPEEGIVLENAESNPIYLKSRSEAKKYEREHNVQLGCL